MTVCVPVNAHATAVVPILSAANVTVLEGSVVVWAEGDFHAGPPGINDAVAGGDGRSVAFAVGSGSYQLVAQARSRSSTPQPVYLCLYL